MIQEKGDTQKNAYIRERIEELQKKYERNHVKSKILFKHFELNNWTCYEPMYCLDPNGYIQDVDKEVFPESEDTIFRLIVILQKQREIRREILKCQEQLDESSQPA